MSVSVAIAAGGTGGHVLPGLAIAEALRAREPEARVVFIGTRAGIERRIVTEAGYRIHATRAKPFGRGRRALTGPASLIGATIDARRILRAERVGVVIGMGGYPSVPVVLAARTLAVPSIIHEANAVPGLANQIAARVTPHVAVCFPATASAFGSRTPHVTGMPLRESIVRADRDALRGEALKAFDLDPERRTLLCFGGSLGAASLGAATVSLARSWRERDDVQIVLAAGADKADAVRASIGDAGWVRVEPYIERMDLAYAAADLVVARAGSSTVAELAAVGVASVLVPFPHARRSEQHENARLLTEAGAAIMLEDRDLARLAEVIEPLLADPGTLEAMGRAARAVARVDAGQRIAEWALTLAGGRR